MITEIESATQVPAFARAMDAAIVEAARFRGATAPNPTVGCALLDTEGTILVAAAHQRAGGPHAEAAAIAAARDRGLVERIASVVVTLEPCNHHGRTPPCSEAILATPARHVVVGARDPNPVAGGGYERLRAAGLTVAAIGELNAPEAAALAARCAALLAPFRKRIATGRPFVTVKQALDAAGSMIPPPGAKTFTSEPALAYAHGLRRRADAILTGSGTVIADDPAFTVRRVPDHPGRRRRLVVLDRRRRVPETYLAAARARGFEPSLADDVATALDELGASGALEVLVEAGPAVTGAILAAGLWDEHIVVAQGAGEGGADRATIRRRDGETTAFDLV